MKFFARAILLLVLSVGLHVKAETVVTDQNGRKVVIPDRVNRIAVLIVPGASMAVSVDLGASRLAGIHPGARIDITEGLLGHMIPATRQIQANLAGDGFVPNVEAILAVNPDIVIQWGDAGSAIVDPIVALGIPVLTFRYGSGETVAGWQLLMGQALTGRKARGEELAARFMQVRKKVAKEVAGVPDGRRPKVLYLHRAHGNAFQVAGGKTSMDYDITLAGGINLARGLNGFAQISVEQLLLWKPDILLLNNFEKEMHPGIILQNPMLSGVPAVRDRRVYLYPQGGFRWDPPSHESLLTWQWLQALFHPEMKTSPLREEIVNTYRMLYDYTPTADDLDKVLRMNENGSSLHYREKFGHVQGRP